VDVLADAVAAMRTGRPHSARAAWRVPFERRFPASTSAGFHILRQGRCWLIPPAGAPVALATGDVVFFPRGSAHGLAGDPTSQTAAPAPVTLCGAYLLDRTRTHPLLAELPEVVHLPAGNGQGLPATVDLLGAELDRPRPGTEAMVTALLDVMLLQILRAWLDKRSEYGDRGWAAALGDPAVVVSLQAIHDDPDRKWTVAALATRAGLSRAAFARRFATLVGVPPLAYLTWWRMTLAARLLRDGDAPLATVARKVGYRSEYAFSHAFKRDHGVSPGAYRRSARVDQRDRPLDPAIPAA
jgi:AraC-like DNA-binding protein